MSAAQARARLAGAAALAVAVVAVAANLPAPERPARAQGSKMASACSATVREAADDPLHDCRTGAVTVTMAVTCPPALPFHAVVVVARHLLMEDHLDDAKAAARDAVNVLDFTPETRMGVVSLSVQERVEQEMTEKKGSVVAAIGQIKLDNVDPTLNYYDWLGRAGRMLEKARETAAAPPLEAVVLYSTGCPTGFESYCNRQSAAAGQLKSQGITVIGVCNPRARPFGIPLPNNHCRHIQQMASAGYYYDLGQASQVGRALVDLQAMGHGLRAGTVTLSEQLAGAVGLVPGSGVPAPVVEGAKLTFTWNGVAAGQTVSATYAVAARGVGRAALRTPDSRVTIVDNLLRVSAPITVPQRTVDVVPCAAPTPTDAPPSATATASPTSVLPTPTATDSPRPTPTDVPSDTATPAPTPAPSATPTAEAHPVYFPVALRHVCTVAERTSDVVLAIDASTSMHEALGETTRLAAAQAAARRFVALLDLGPHGDQAAVVAFNAAATVSAPLGADRAALIRAIDGVSTALGTRIDLAIVVSTAILAGPDARAGSQPVLVVLTDGRPDGGTGDAALAAAVAARARGVTLYVVGLGDAVDEAFLRELAGRPDAYLHAPDGAALEAIYAGLATALPCAGGVVWVP